MINQLHNTLVWFLAVLVKELVILTLLTTQQVNNAAHYSYKIPSKYCK